jgi:hypothetical protein
MRSRRCTGGSHGVASKLFDIAAALPIIFPWPDPLPSVGSVGLEFADLYYGGRAKGFTGPRRDENYQPRAAAIQFG